MTQRSIKISWLNIFITKFLSSSAKRPMLFTSAWVLPLLLQRYYDLLSSSYLQVTRDHLIEDIHTNQIQHPSYSHSNTTIGSGYPSGILSFPFFLPSRPRNKEVAQWQSPSCVWLSLLCTIQLVYCRWTPQETRGEESHLVSLYAHLFTSRPEDEEGTYAPKKKSQVLKYRPSFFEKRGIDRAPFF